MTFNSEVLLDTLQGDKETARFIAASFLDDTPHQLDSLAEAIRRADAPATIFAAHSIKGSAATIGGGDVEEVARKLEQLGKSGDIDQAARWMPELTARFERLRCEMEAFCSGG